MYNENSILIKTWVKLVNNGTYNKEQVPDLGNLREVVFSLIA